MVIYFIAQPSPSFENDGLLFRYKTYSSVENNVYKWGFLSLALFLNVS
jgi:hypothetical protein